MVLVRALVSLVVGATAAYGAAGFGFTNRDAGERSGSGCSNSSSSSGSGSDGEQYSWIPAAIDQSTCGPSSFGRAESGPAADWRHCAALFSSMAKRNGTFWIRDGGEEDDGDMIAILKTTNCMFGVKGGGGEGKKRKGVVYIVGDRDVKTILETALQDYSEGMHLEVQGDVECAISGSGKAKLHWQIYGDGECSKTS